VSRQGSKEIEYRCPGQRYAISRAVHLGRLARFYSACRECPHAEDTQGLSARRVKQLAEIRQRPACRSHLGADTVGGVYLNDLDPLAARQIAAALGVRLLRRSPRAPLLAVAGDGRAMTCEMVAAAGEGLRWAGCNVVDIGPATAACLRFAAAHLRAAGGLMVGNPGDRPHLVALKFFDAAAGSAGGGETADLLRTEQEITVPGKGAVPFSLRENRDSPPVIPGLILRDRRLPGVDRPTRTFGSLRRFQAEKPYLATLADSYHALRPLRLLLDSTCAPLIGYLRELTAPTACRIVLRRDAGERVPEQIIADKAHFAVSTDGDGETVAVFDQRGRRVERRRLAALLGADVPLRDALATVTMLLVLLSRSDRRFSEVLDLDAAVK